MNTGAAGVAFLVGHYKQPFPPHFASPSFFCISWCFFSPNKYMYLLTIWCQYPTQVLFNSRLSSHNKIHGNFKISLCSLGWPRILRDLLDWVSKDWGYNSESPHPSTLGPFCNIRLTKCPTTRSLCQLKGTACWHNLKHPVTTKLHTRNSGKLATLVSHRPGESSAWSSIMWMTRTQGHKRSLGWGAQSGFPGKMQDHREEKWVWTCIRSEVPCSFPAWVTL